MKSIQLIFALVIVSSSVAQRSSVHESQIMYKKEVTRALDLREKQNQPLFARGHEITQVLINAVQSGLLKPYSSDSLTQQISKEAFLESLEISSEMAPVDTNYMDSLDLIDYRQQMKNYKPDRYSAKDLYQMEMKEELLFDKLHSVMEQNITSITIFIPAEHPDNIKGIQIPVASFSFKDCMAIFKDDPRAIWYNPKNEQEHKNLTDAFDLRLFSSYIIKISNPEDAYLMDIYGYGKRGIIASENAEMQLQEFESHLWEN